MSTRTHEHLSPHRSTERPWTSSIGSSCVRCCVQQDSAWCMIIHGVTFDATAYYTDRCSQLRTRYQPRPARPAQKRCGHTMFRQRTDVNQQTSNDLWCKAVSALTSGAQGRALCDGAVPCIFQDSQLRARQSWLQAGDDVVAPAGVGDQIRVELSSGNQHIRYA
jgi:hypothetical protein